MQFQDDAVVRTVYHKYLHPKEVYVSHGILDPELAIKKDVRSQSKSRGGAKADAKQESSEDQSGLSRRRHAIEN